MRVVLTLGIFALTLSLCACGGGGGGSSAAPTVPQASVAALGAATISSSSGAVVLSPLADVVTGEIAAGSSPVTVAALSTADVAGVTSLPLETMGIAFAGTPAQGTVRVPLAVSSGAPAVPQPPPVERFAAEAPEAVASALSHVAVSAAGAAAVRRTQGLPVTVGSTTSFWIQAATLGAASGSYAQLGAELAAVTAHGYIWIDSSLTSVLSSPAAVAELAADFENAYASDTTHFGVASYTTAAPGYAAHASVQACDASGNRTGQSTPLYIDDADPRIVVFVVNTQSLGSGVGGYFSASNFWTVAAANCTLGTSNVVRTNAAPMIYVGYVPALPSGFPANYELAEDDVRAAAHELQHLVNFVNHVIVSNGAQEQTWINEGLSMLAQDLAVPRLFGVTNDVDDAVAHAARYLAAPQNFSLTGFSGIDPVANGGTGQLQYNCPSCYGAEYLFQRYLYDRFGGDAYLHAMETSGQTGYANLAAATQSDVATLLAQFGVALAASGTGITTDPAYTFSGLALHGALQDQFGATLTLAGPQTASSISPGADASVGQYLGTFLYLSLGGVGSSGATITISDPAGQFGLRGALLHHP